MAKQKQKVAFRVRIIRGGIILVLLGLIFTSIMLISKNSTVAEFMSTTVSRALLTAFGAISSIFPFSLFEIFVILAIVFVIFCLVRFFASIKREGKNSILRLIRLTSTILCVVILYQLCVGFAYHRAPLNLPAATKQQIDDEFAIAAATYFTKDFADLASTLERDENGCVKMPYSNKELGRILKDEYKRLDNGYLSSFTPNFKEIFFSFAMAEMNIAGVFFGPLGEPNITKYALDYEKPALAAHELAHAKGVMREYEADLTAAYLLLTSENPYLRYSGYMHNYYAYLLSPIYYIDSDLYGQLDDQIPDEIANEYAKSYEIYQKYNTFSSLGNKLNDLYLRLNGQKDGTDSYNDFGDVTIIEPSEPENPTDPIEPPKYIYTYSQTEKILLSIFSQ